jgi:hypothetical protein
MSPEEPRGLSTAPKDRTQNSYIRVEGGFVAGLMLGVVPFYSVGHQLLDEGKVLPHGTPDG